MKLINNKKAQLIDGMGTKEWALLIVVVLIILIIYISILKGWIPLIGK